MIICGLNMEMEMAKEMDLIGKCMGCLYLDYVTFHKVGCEKKRNSKWFTREL